MDQSILVSRSKYKIIIETEYLMSSGAYDDAITITYYD